MMHSAVWGWLAAVSGAAVIGGLVITWRRQKKGLGKALFAESLWEILVGVLSALK